MRILALDLGTHCGVAVEDTDKKSFYADTWHLAQSGEITGWGKTRMNRRQDPRILRLTEKLEVFEDFDVVVFEDVEFQTYTQQCQLWSSFRAAVWLAFQGPNTLLECVPVATLKKFATGSGAATKEMMAASLYREFPELKNNGYDDNAVDAIWLLKWAKKHLSRIAR
jgi:Holliday junction resolvasome RuvABC endonuclease subunit